tara:strand:+ start:69 stop:461 length:393 start_codon:yes stop_codon:yes gene_type:complete
MNHSQVDNNWPNALRWFLCQNLSQLTPWHLLERATEFDSAANAFEREDVKCRKVFVFASRQDNDDFAGLEIIDGKISDTVICFHPVFSSGESKREWDITDQQYVDVFEFVAKQVIPDMKDWAITEDAADL